MPAVAVWTTVETLFLSIKITVTPHASDHFARAIRSFRKASCKWFGNVDKKYKVVSSPNKEIDDGILWEISLVRIKKRRQECRWAGTHGNGVPTIFSHFALKWIGGCFKMKKKLEAVFFLFVPKPFLLALHSWNKRS